MNCQGTYMLTLSTMLKVEMCSKFYDQMREILGWVVQGLARYVDIDIRVHSVYLIYYDL